MVPSVAPTHWIADTTLGVDGDSNAPPGLVAPVGVAMTRLDERFSCASSSGTSSNSTLRPICLVQRSSEAENSATSLSPVITVGS